VLSLVKASGVDEGTHAQNMKAVGGEEAEADSHNHTKSMRRTSESSHHWDPDLFGCDDYPTPYPGDGYCDEDNNYDSCFDGGDCCPRSCEENCGDGSCEYTCGDPDNPGYDCRDERFQPSPPSPPSSAGNPLAVSWSLFAACGIGVLALFSACGCGAPDATGSRSLHDRPGTTDGFGTGFNNSAVAYASTNTSPLLPGAQSQGNTYGGLYPPQPSFSHTGAQSQQVKTHGGLYPSVPSPVAQPAQPVVPEPATVPIATGASDATTSVSLVQELRELEAAAAAKRDFARAGAISAQVDSIEGIEKRLAEAIASRDYTTADSLNTELQGALTEARSALGLGNV
jgi:hypothetical protein